MGSMLIDLLTLLFIGWAQSPECVDGSVYVYAPVPRYVDVKGTEDGKFLILWCVNKTGTDYFWKLSTGTGTEEIQGQIVVRRRVRVRIVLETLSTGTEFP